MTVAADEFKQCLARWATGVTIVTARAGDHIHGMTVSAFTEVSLDPPLVLVCADKTTNTHPVIAEGGAPYMALSRWLFTHVGPCL